jgi:hypothetical protein
MIFKIVALLLRLGSFMECTVSGSCTAGTVVRQLRPKILDTIGSLQRQMAGEPYTPYQETTPPLQAEEGEGHQPRKN